MGIDVEWKGEKSSGGFVIIHERAEQGPAKLSFQFLASSNVFMSSATTT